MFQSISNYLNSSGNSGKYRKGIYKKLALFFSIFLLLLKKYNSIRFRTFFEEQKIYDSSVMSHHVWIIFVSKIYNHKIVEKIFWFNDFTWFISFFINNLNLHFYCIILINILDYILTADLPNGHIHYKFAFIIKFGSNDQW